MATGKVVRESLDRLSIIIMGGVAAEADKYGKTEGGLDDERQLIDFFQTQVQPGTYLPFISFSFTHNISLMVLYLPWFDEQDGRLPEYKHKPVGQLHKLYY